MSLFPDSFDRFVESKNEDGGATLSLHYLGEELSGLNADQIVLVANELWHDFCRSQPESGGEFSKEELAQRFGEWKFVRGGTTKVEIAMNGNQQRVDRFCGAWALGSDETAAFIDGLYEAAPADKRP